MEVVRIKGRRRDKGGRISPLKRNFFFVIVLGCPKV
jgi:hypothetical protein